MKVAEKIYEFSKVSLAVSGMLVALGLLSWQIMPKEEDPRLKERNGIITIVYPGTDTLEMQRQVSEVLEEELAQVPEIQTLETTIRSQISITRVILRDSLTNDSDINEAWNKARNAIDTALDKMPSGIVIATLERNLMDQDAAVYALTGSSRLALLEQAKSLRKMLLRVSTVSRVNIIGDPGEQITVAVNDDALAAAGLAYGDIVQVLRGANEQQASGYYRQGNRQINVRTTAGFSSVEEIRKLPIELKSAKILPLEKFARVEKTTKVPLEEFVAHNGATALTIGVQPRAEIDLIKFGEDVRAVVEQYRTDNPDSEIHEISFQPQKVNERLGDLARSLLTGVAIVAVLLLALMGLRVGLFVALMVPIITLISLAIFAAGGGVLHQISVSAFVVALGLLVDNVLVMVDGVQTRIDKGASSKEAGIETIREFAGPLAAASGTTIAAFLPMLGSTGDTADFTRMIPLVTILTLVVSFVISVFLIPSLSSRIQRKGKSVSWKPIENLVRSIATVVFNFPKSVVLFALVLVALTGSFFGKLPQKFFPSADRSQIVVDVRFPEGTHVDYTFQKSTELAEAIQQLEAVTSHTLFVGRGTPQFYYNLVKTTKSPHVAQLMVELEEIKDFPQVAKAISEIGDVIAPEATVLAKSLAQGPPVKADLQIMVLGGDHEKVNPVAKQVYEKLKNMPELQALRSTYDDVQPTSDFIINDMEARKWGVDRRQIAGALLGRTLGIPAGTYRASQDPIPIILMSDPKKETNSKTLAKAFLAQTRTGEITVETLSSWETSEIPATLTHRNRKVMTEVLAELTPGISEAEAVGKIQEKMATLEIPSGIEIKYGGTTEESEAANRAILKALPIGILIMVISLLVQFNSFIKLGMVFLTVPLSIVGVVLGLFLTGQSFGFMPLLGLLALIGIVVNNAILLISRIDENLADGMALQDALVDATGRRFRPIVLTTLTTVSGLAPLTFSEATLWPPFAWTIISGLLGSTVLTLFVVPCVYKVLYGEKRFFKGGLNIAKAASLTGLIVTATLLTPSSATSKERLSLQQAMSAAANSYEVKVAEHEVTAATSTKEKSLRAGFMPRLGVIASQNYLDRDLNIETPFGFDLPGRERVETQAGIKLVQPLYRPSEMFDLPNAANHRIDSKKSALARSKETARAKVATAYLDALRLRVRLDSNKEFIANLESNLGEVKRLFKLGRVSDLDLLKIEQGVALAKQANFKLSQLLGPAEQFVGFNLGKNTQVETSFDGVRQFAGPKIILLNDAGPGRKDLDGIRQSIAAVDAQVSAITSKYLPEVTGEVSYSIVDPTSFNDDRWLEGKLVLSWTLFAGGTRSSEKRELLAHKSALQENLRMLSNGRQVALSRLKAELASLESERKLNDDLLKRAQRVYKIESRRYKEGRISLTDLIDAAQNLRQRREASQLTMLDLVETKVRAEVEVGGR